MSAQMSIDRQALVQGVRGNLSRAAQHTDRLRKAHTSLLLTSMFSSALSTLVAGVTAANGPLVGLADNGWRLACIVAAIFGFITTVTVGVVQQLRLSERVAQSNECVSRLKALDIAITAGSRDWDAVAREYEDIARSHPDLIGS